MPKRHFDSDLEDAPRRRRRRVKRKSGPNPALILTVAGLGFLLVTGILVGGYFLLRVNSGPPAPPQDPFPGMLAHWSFDKFEGEQVVVDETGRGNNGRFMAGRIAPGYKGNAYWSDGRDDQYIDVSQCKDLNFAEGAEFTVAAWYQTREKAGTILAFRNSQRRTQLDLYVRDNHLLCIVGDDDDPGPEHAFCWCNERNDDKWHHAAFTRSGKVVSLFYDGLLVKTDSNRHSGGRLTGDMRYIGVNLKFDDNEKQLVSRVGFKGGIDEVYVFSRALTATEIQSLMKH